MVLRKVVVAIALFSVVVSLTGCMSSSAGLAPSTIPLADASKYTVLSQEDVSGSSWGVSLSGLVSISEMSTAKSRDRAIEMAGADALIDVTTNNHLYMIPLIPTPFTLNLYRITVDGKPIKLM